jgi:hypothetical protein
MRVVATQVGQYNQVVREVGEVFDLLKFPDGTYPQKTRAVPKKDKDGKDTGETTLVVVKLKDGKPAHRDFAPDQGVRVIRNGPGKGETVQSGWMRAVPAHVQPGLYPPGTDFWTPNTQLPQPIPQFIGQQDKRATPIAAYLNPHEQPDVEELEE